MTPRHQARGLLSRAPQRVYVLRRYCVGCKQSRGLDGGAGGRKPWLCGECWPKVQAREAK